MLGECETFTESTEIAEVGFGVCAIPPGPLSAGSLGLAATGAVLPASDTIDSLVIDHIH